MASVRAVSRSRPPANPTAAAPPLVGTGRSGPAFFPEFEGLRAIAALLVLVVHTAFESGLTGHSGPWGRYTARAEIGVPVFFLISGFLLYRPFIMAHLTNAPSPRLKPYLLRRAARILPLYWVVLTVAHLTHAIKPFSGVGDYATYYGLAQIYTQSHILRGVGQSWSLDIEVSFYLLLPLYALGVRRLARGRDRRGQLRVEGLALLVGVVISEAFKIWLLTAKPANHEVMASWLPAYLDLFALGMGLGLLSAAAATGSVLPAWTAHRRVALASWILAGGAYLAVSWGAGLSRLPIFHATLRQALLERLFYALFALFLLLPAVLAPAGSGLIRRFLRCRPMAYLGLVSYGIYLWHEVVITKLLDWTPWKLFQVLWGELALASLGLTLVLASLTYVLIERPGMSLGRRATQIRRARELEVTHAR